MGCRVAELARARRERLPPSVNLLAHLIVATCVISVTILLQLSSETAIELVACEPDAAQQHDQQQHFADQQDFGGETSDDSQNSEQASQQDDPFAISSAGAGAAAGAAANQNKLSQCERIKFDFCSSMPYTFARPTNFFGDANQIEAAERARQYEPLVRSQCSRQLLAYLCELLAPVCVNEAAMSKFDIYPCRSLCRQVSSDCSDQIADLSERYSFAVAQAAFACDRLPYERNGGLGQLNGPCHDTPELNASETKMTNTYKPYRKEIDPNIADNSPIDPRIIRPIQPPPSPPVQPPTQPPYSTQQQPTQTRASNEEVRSNVAGQLWTQLQQLGQQLAHALARHSNLLSILALICLVLVLNAKRLKRAQNYLVRECRFSSSSSSSSSRKSSSSTSSSAGSERKLAHKLTISPSSSSRSLMLFANCDGKRSKPNNKLISCSSEHHHHHLQQQQQQQIVEPSQKLLHQAGLGQRTTLINVNGTLEGQQQNSAAARYHLIQSLNSQQLAIIANADNNAKHDYDYIQMPAGQKQQQQQHYNGSSSSELVESSREYKRHQDAASFRSTAAAAAATQWKSSSSKASSGQLAQHEPQLYSNILLSSPSHQILLFGDDTQQHAFDRLQATRHHHHHHHQHPTEEPPPPPTCLPPPLPMQQSHLMNLASSSYAAPFMSSALIDQQQRSFQRRPSVSGSGSLSSRNRRTGAQVAATNLVGATGTAATLATVGGAGNWPQQAQLSYPSSSGSSTASSTGSSSAASSAFSPPGAANNSTAINSCPSAGHHQPTSRSSAGSRT